MAFHLLGCCCRVLTRAVDKNIVVMKYTIREEPGCEGTGPIGWPSHFSHSCRQGRLITREDQYQFQRRRILNTQLKMIVLFCRPFPNLRETHSVTQSMMSFPLVQTTPLWCTCGAFLETEIERPWCLLNKSCTAITPWPYMSNHLIYFSLKTRARI